MVAAALDAAGIPAQGVDARGVIVTDETFGRAMPLVDETRVAAARMVQPLLDARTVPVLPGFIGSTRKGVATTLGRGGSDWSGAGVGAGLEGQGIHARTGCGGVLTVEP